MAWQSFDGVSAGHRLGHHGHADGVGTIFLAASFTLVGFIGRCASMCQKWASVVESQVTGKSCGTINLLRCYTMQWSDEGREHVTQANRVKMLFWVRCMLFHFREDDDDIITKRVLSFTFPNVETLKHMSHERWLITGIFSLDRDNIHHAKLLNRSLTNQEHVTTHPAIMQNAGKLRCSASAIKLMEHLEDCFFSTSLNVV